jgi:uncharacterized RDD family membrane protein YckC
MWAQKTCGRCGALVSLSAHAGENCPRCGAYWGHERTSGGFGKPSAFGGRAEPSLYAGLWLRGVASVIDSAVCSSLLLVGVGVTAAVFAGAQGLTPDDLRDIAWTLIVLGNALAVVALYFGLLESSRKQATLGKMAVGIVVTDLSGNRISRRRALARAFAKLLSALPLYGGYLLAGFTSKKQALHDLITSTLVVPRSRARPWSSA